MLFSSVTFIYYFLPITLLLYIWMPIGHGDTLLRGKNSLLLLASFLFYAFAEPRYVVLMIASIGIGYMGGRILNRHGNKWVLWVFLSLQLSLLGVFKYTDFLIETWNSITNENVSMLYLVLPIGISFYSFQIISYLVDVYRCEIEAEKSVIDFAIYIAMFPQLIAGPIVRYDVIQPQLVKREIKMEYVSEGATRFLVGLGKKVIIADNLGELLLRIEQIQDKSIWSYWLIAIMYTLQIYHDFSGYSDMAIGLGKMFGFTIPENFRYPMISTSITEFWRRWHISLGSFFRDYIYLPLGGSNCSTWRWMFNIGVVWFLSGLWHGASWNFVLWGIYFGLFLMLEKFILCRDSNRMGVGYVWIVVVISFVLFRFVDIREGISFIGEMFRVNNYTISYLEWYEYRNAASLVLIGILGATPIATKAVGRIRNRIKKPYVDLGMELMFQIGMLLIVTAFLIQSSVHPFLYFRF